ncbi:MAG: response regulator [Fusobacterium sp.]|nr:response regulator [Fusobacterium sp.]
MEKLKVVVIEDETLTRLDIVEILKENNYDVVGEASDGIEGLELCKKLKPDIVLLDIKIPHISGLKVAEILEKEKLESCVIILTAYNIAEYIKKASSTTAMAYLLKPIEEEIFVERLRLIYKNYRLYKDMKEEVEDTKKKLEDRKLIERAKGIVMVKYNLGEDQAYKKMRALSMEKRISLSKLSEIIILAGGLE